MERMTMNTLIPESIEKFLGKFYSCNDGLLRAITIFHTNKVNPNILVTILTMHDGSEFEDDWFTLEILLEEAGEFLLKMSPNMECQVISFGISVIFEDEIFYVDLSGAGGGDLKDVESIREDDFFVTGKRMSWSIGPYFR
jgi:hypothetical protein